MDKVYVGLDLGSTTCHVVGKSLEGEERWNRKFPTGEKSLVAQFQDWKGDTVVNLEAGELAGWACRILRRQPRVEVVVSDPKKNAWIAKDQNKNDAMDAGKLADHLRLGIAQKHQVYVDPELDRVRFKQTVQDYERTRDNLKRIKLQLKAKLRVEGIICRGSRVYSEKGRPSILAKIQDLLVRDLVEGTYEELDFLRAHKDKCVARIHEQAKRFPEVERLQSHPGLNLINSARFVGYVQNPHRFSSARKLFRYSRLSVAQAVTNGRPIGPAHIDRSGVGALKDVSRKTYQAAMLCKESNRYQRKFREACARGVAAHAVRLSLQREIMATLWAMWKRGTSYKDSMG